MIKDGIKNIMIFQINIRENLVVFGTVNGKDKNSRLKEKAKGYKKTLTSPWRRDYNTDISPFLKP